MHENDKTDATCTAETITNKQIEELRLEAIQAQNLTIANVCDKALDGNKDYIKECAYMLSVSHPMSEHFETIYICGISDCGTRGVAKVVVAIDDCSADSGWLCGGCLVTEAERVRDEPEFYGLPS